MKIELVRAIKHFKSDLDGEYRGIYEVDIDGKREVIIRNGNSVGMVQFYVDRPVSECVPIVRQTGKAALNLGKYPLDTSSTLFGHFARGICYYKASSRSMQSGGSPFLLLPISILVG